MWHRHATLIISIAYFSAGKIQSHTINVIRKNSTSSKFFSFSFSLSLLKTFAIKWHSPQVEFIFLRKCRFHKFIMRFIRFNSQLFTFLLPLLLFFLLFAKWTSAGLWNLIYCVKKCCTVEKKKITAEKYPRKKNALKADIMKSHIYLILFLCKQNACCGRKLSVNWI